MKVRELVQRLGELDQELTVVVKLGKYGFQEARQVEVGFFYKDGLDFTPDIDKQGGTNSVLIED